jgi:predicted subunit of tRNA(5-methylaminomethyl-2-thiouridylate) methyltransferase
MKAGVLFSGGKDSALAALMLSRDYDVELNTFVFDATRPLAAVERAAEALGFPLYKRAFDSDLLEQAVTMLVACGYPNDAINHVHRRAIETLCGCYRVVGDGTRLNDRVPMISTGEVQRYEARYGSSYVRPLLGFGKPEVERLVGRTFRVVYGESGEIDNADYEHEIREALLARKIDPASLFPARHLQSLVVGVTANL